jgi:predicted metal-binding membrane protein
VFVLGYLLVWAGYSLAGSVGQWGLRHSGAISPGGWSTSPNDRTGDAARAKPAG